MSIDPLWFGFRNESNQTEGGILKPQWNIEHEHCRQLEDEPLRHRVQCAYACGMADFSGVRWTPNKQFGVGARSFLFLVLQQFSKTAEVVGCKRNESQFNGMNLSCPLSMACRGRRLFGFWSNQPFVVAEETATVEIVQRFPVCVPAVSTYHDRVVLNRVIHLH